MALKIRKPSLDVSRLQPKQGKAFSASKGSKYILFIGDEGVILIYMRGIKVISRHFVPDASQQSFSEIRSTLEEDPKAPIIMVIDTLDQSFVQQTLPPVSSLGVGKLIKRRLERVFGPDDIKGAILLGREKSGRKDWNYMMISLERTPQLGAWFDFISELPNYFQGIYLVAAETELLVKRLERALQVPKTGTGAEWKFLVSHNKVGGFRQVILHNGRIVFTRLAQPIGESNFAVIAGNIEQEILSTIEYMKRLSFSAQAGLDIYIIASKGIKNLIDKSKFNANSLQVFTPFDLAGYLGIEGATQPSDQFGDVILGAVIGASRRHVLTLTSPQFSKLKNLHQIMRYQRVAAVLAFISVLGYVGSEGFDLYNLSQKSDDLTQQYQLAQQQLEKLKVEIKQSKIDVQGASDLIDLYHRLLDKQVSPLPFLERLTPITESPVWIKAIEWSLGSAPASQPGRPTVAAAPKGEQMAATISLEFPEAANDSKVFRVVAKRVLTDFKNIFKSVDVKYTSLPQGFLENDRLDIDLNSEKSVVDKKSNSSSNNTPEAQLTITGAMADVLKTDNAAAPGAVVPASAMNAKGHP